MTYSIQYGQICGICQDSTDLVGKFEKTSPYSVDPVIEIKGRLLKKCGHAFHEACINRALYSGARVCPMCRSELDPSDQEYGMTKDCAPPEGYQRYFSNKEKRNYTIMSPSNVPPAYTEFVLKNADAIFKGNLNPQGLVLSRNFSFKN
jgi:RING-H2 zinc finger domain